MGDLGQFVVHCATAFVEASADARKRNAMSSSEIDDYLETVPSPQREVLGDLRAMILNAINEVEEGISYRIPAFRVEGGVAAGFAAFSNHMSYFPFSGSVLAQLSDEIATFAHTKSALHFTTDAPLSGDLVARLIAVRLSEINDRGR
jgi:uncharacterized protein YdhG (YjbR/CyaY superfamily)